MRSKTIQLLFVILFLPAIGFSQVKIGDPTDPPDPKAVLELKDTTRGLLLPRMTTDHMNAITSPPDGLLIYNKTAQSIYQYRATDNLWMPLRSDSAEWFLDTTSKKLYLRRALAIEDSTYYNTVSKKFLFGDTRYFTGTTGIPFNMDEGNSDKFIFKTTASKFPRSLPNLNSAGIYAVYEADNDPVAIDNPYMVNYTSVAAATVIGVDATQKVGAAFGISVSNGNAGQDTVQIMYGVNSNTYTRGNSYTETLMGNFNSVSVGGTNNANVGEVYGNYVNLTYVSPATATRRILGDIYGQFIGISGSLMNKVDGVAYGLFMPTVRASSSNNNFAIFTLKGHNHFGDSTLISDGPGFKARAVLDIQSSSSMIIPAGNTLQRPLTGINGMLRYNLTTATLEYFKNTGWATGASVITGNQVIDPPLINPGTTLSVIVPVTDANSNFSVSVSPTLALPSGIFIAWARVSTVGFVEISFGNMSGVAVDLPATTYTIKLVQ